MPVARAQPIANSECIAEVSGQIDAIADRREWERSRWGILVQTTSGQTLYARRAREYFTPASTVKLFTSAAALEGLGADYRFRTAIGESRELGGLILSSSGDPSFTTEQLQALLAQLIDRGIGRIPNLYVLARDEEAIAPETHPTWEWEDVYASYGAPVTRLILNENAVTLTLLPSGNGTGVALEWSDAIAARQWQVINRATIAPPGTPYGVEIIGRLGEPTLSIRGEMPASATPDKWELAIRDPQRYAIDLLRSLSISAGIAIGNIEPITGDRSFSTLAAIDSPPLSILLQEVNQHSNNLYAEAILHQLGRDANTQAIAAFSDRLTALGIPPDSYNLVDGSGLSRRNAVAPEAIVRVLQVMLRSPQFGVFRESLAVSATSGTLRFRFRETPLAGRIWGKSGGLTGVASLAGYIDRPNTSMLIFSVAINHGSNRGAENRAAIDEIVGAIAQFGQCD